jgi:hypothetical protein
MKYFFICMVKSLVTFVHLEADHYKVKYLQKNYRPEKNGERKRVYNKVSWTE